MEHISIELLNKYIAAREYEDENAELFENISEHIMGCDDCAEKYRKILMVNQAVEEFTVEDYDCMVTHEERLIEEYQILKLIRGTENKELGLGIKNWMRKLEKGIKNQIQLHLCDDKLNNVSGMIIKSMEKISLLANMEPDMLVAARGEGGAKKELSTILLSNSNPNNKISLDGSSMSVYVQIEDKGQYKDPPIGILLPKDKEGTPVVKAAEKNKQIYSIEFNDLEPGEYMFYINE